MTNTTVVIPIYWTWPSSESGRAEMASYDHPTPLDGISTLPRLLDDLCDQSGPAFRVLILTGLAHAELGQSVTDRVHALLSPYHNRLQIHVCDAPAVARLHAVLETADLPFEGLNLSSYAGVRNLQLVVPHVLGSQVIVALDDDESIASDYMERALTSVGQNAANQRVLGLTGPYLQPDGGFLLSEPPLTGNPFLDKAHYINDAMRSLMNTTGTLVPSPIALGGNMIFHHDLFTVVPFDPGITRGEDIDYLINARLQGFGWWFNTELAILHLPSTQFDTPRYQRMREDIIRFFYEREKLRMHGHTKVEWLDPYPGSMLRNDLTKHALSALQSEATSDLVTRFGDPQSIIEQALAHMLSLAPLYPRFVKEWGRLMTRIEQDVSLRRKLVAATTQP